MKREKNTTGKKKNQLKVSVQGRFARTDSKVEKEELADDCALGKTAKEDCLKTTSTGILSKDRDRAPLHHPQEKF